MKPKDSAPMAEPEVAGISEETKRVIEQRKNDLVFIILNGRLNDRDLARITDSLLALKENPLSFYRDDINRLRSELSNVSDNKQKAGLKERIVKAEQIIEELTQGELAPMRDSVESDSLAPAAPSLESQPTYDISNLSEDTINEILTQIGGAEKLKDEKFKTERLRLLRENPLAFFEKEIKSVTTRLSSNPSLRRTIEKWRAVVEDIKKNLAAPEKSESKEILPKTLEVPFEKVEEQPKVTPKKEQTNSVEHLIINTVNQILAKPINWKDGETVGRIRKDVQVALRAQGLDARIFSAINIGAASTMAFMHMWFEEDKQAGSFICVSLSGGKLAIMPILLVVDRPREVFVDLMNTLYSYDDEKGLDNFFRKPIGSFTDLTIVTPFPNENEGYGVTKRGHCGEKVVTSPVAIEDKAVPEPSKEEALDPVKLLAELEAELADILAPKEDSSEMAALMVNAEKLRETIRRLLQEKRTLTKTSRRKYDEWIENFKKDLKKVKEEMARTIIKEEQERLEKLQQIKQRLLEIQRSGNN